MTVMDDQKGIKDPSTASIQMLLALNDLDKPMYEGTVPRAVILKRRARNKRARLSRRRNHGT